MKTTRVLGLLAVILATSATTAASARVARYHPSAEEQTIATLRLNNGNQVEQFFRNLELNGN